MVGDPAPPFEGPRFEGPRFEVLGPLRAVRDDAALDLGPGKQRAVLAVLLANANRPVPAPRIVDAVWRDNPPANGPNVVQKYVAGLRRVLEPDRSPRSGGRVLRLTDAGYLLEVAPGCLDTDLFDSLVRDAGISRDDGKLNDASAELRAALALWRGEAYAGLPGPVIEAERQRLAEGRADALETVAEIELELGHHGRLVPELTRLVAEFPQRERLRRLLMLALYRCGRQTEALAEFRSARGYLAEEFGVEPGEPLRRLHERILRADPALDLAPHAAPPPPPSAPPGSLARPAPSVPSAPPSAPSPAPPPGPPFAPAVPSSPEWRPYAERPAPDPAPTAPHTPTGPPGPAPGRARWATWADRALAIALPLVTFGLAGWGVIAYFAVRRRSWPLAVAALGYLACTVFFLATASDPNLRDGSTRDNLALLAWLVAMIGSAVHATALAFGQKPAQ